MLLRKVNAVLSLIITALLLSHAISHAAWMLSDGRIAIGSRVLSWVLFGLMMVHALICIDFAVSGHADAEKKKCHSYPKQNATAIVQRVGGMLLLLFAVLHVAGTVGFLQPPPLVHAILPPLFFAMALLHAAISVSKAFITLGIGSAKFIKASDLAAKLICAVTLVADVVGFYLYAF